MEILHFRKLVADVKETEPVAKKLFQDLQKANEDMLTNLKRSHEAMQGVGPTTWSPVSKKATLSVTPTPTATAKYDTVQPKNPYAKPPVVVAAVATGISSGHNKNEFNDDEMDNLLANVDADTSKVAAAHALVAVGKAVGNSILVLAEAEAGNDSSIQTNAVKGNLKNDEEYAVAN